MRGENRSTRGTTSRSRVENQQTRSTYDGECGIRTRATLVKASALTTWPTLPKKYIFCWLLIYSKMHFLGISFSPSSLSPFPLKIKETTLVSLKMVDRF